MTAGPPLRQPVVRVVDPRRPEPVAPRPPRRPWSPRTRRLVGGAAVALVLLLLGNAALDLHRSQVQVRAATARAQGTAALRLEVVGARASLVVPVQTEPVQDASVELLLRNAGPAPVRLLDGQLDGSGPVIPGTGRTVAPGGVGVLGTVWRVRCQEVGGLAGPFFLEVRVGLADGAVVPYRLDLQPVAAPDGPARAYRVASLRTCLTIEDAPTPPAPRTRSRAPRPADAPGAPGR